MTIKMKINAENELIEPELHDSEVIEINSSDLRDKQEVRVKLETEASEKFEVMLSNVSHCLIRNLFSQNIVRDVILLKGQSLKDNFKDYLQAFGSLDSLQDNWPIPGPMQLIHFVPSVGVEIIVLCGGIEIRKIN